MADIYTKIIGAGDSINTEINTGGADKGRYLIKPDYDPTDDSAEISIAHDDIFIKFAPGADGAGSVTQKLNFTGARPHVMVGPNWTLDDIDIHGLRSRISLLNGATVGTITGDGAGDFASIVGYGFGTFVDNIVIPSGCDYSVITGIRVNSKTNSLAADAISSAASHTVIVNCYIEDSDDDGIFVSGNHSLIQGNIVAAVDNIGIRTTGDRARIQANTVGGSAGTTSTAFDVSGDDCVVQYNYGKTAHASNNSALFGGNDHAISGNRFVNPAGTGVGLSDGSTDSIKTDNNTN